MWMQSTLNVSRTKLSLMSPEKCSNYEFLEEQLKNYQDGRNLTQKQWRGPTTWKDMLENALSDTANWPNNIVEPLYKVSSLCLDDHHFKKEELESVGGVSKLRSQIVLVDPTVFGQ